MTTDSVEARLLDIEALLDHLTREQGESARTSMRHHGWIWPEDSNALRASISELVALVRRYRRALERIEALPLYRVGTAYGEGAPQWESRYVIGGLPDIIAREALNEEELE